MIKTRAALVVLLAIVVSVASPIAQTGDDDLEKGRQMLQREEYFEALKAYQRANARAGSRSAEAFYGIAQATFGMKVFKNALDACQSAIELAGDNMRLRARVFRLKGRIFDATGEFAAAEAAFRSAIASDPDDLLADLHYDLGVALLHQRRDADAIEELKKEIALRPNNTTAEDARALIDNPRRGRETYAPPFSVKSSSGDTISLESLHGKVVLVDFWASWCAPCIRALPAVKKIQKDHAGDPFVVVGISQDRDAASWQNFTGKNHMIWPQYWDKDHRLGALFEIKAIPSYVLIDAEGIVRMRVRGSGFHQERDLQVEIERQIKRARAPS